MKDYDINLAVPERSVKNIPRLVIAPAYIIFAITFLIASLIVGYSFILKLSSAELSTSGGKIRKQIDSMSLKRDKLLVTSERLASIQKILATRNKLDITILYILSKIPESFSIESISVDSKMITLSVSSPSLSEFATLLSDKLPDSSSNKTAGIDSIRADTFGRSENGYLLSLIFNLKKK